MSRILACLPGCLPLALMCATTGPVSGCGSAGDDLSGSSGTSGAVLTDGHTLQMVVYPGARHGFDAPVGLHYYAGHYVGQDPAAFADSLTEVQRFFAERLAR